MINNLMLFSEVSGEGLPATQWVMNPLLRVALAVGVVIYYIILFIMLKRRRLILKYTLLWMLSGLALILFLIFPQIVFRTSALIGVNNPVNAVFLLFAGFSLLLILSLTSIASQLSDKNRRLNQSVALLDKRVRDLERRQTETD
jgi:hypothetical protein